MSLFAWYLPVGRCGPVGGGVGEVLSCGQLGAGLFLIEASQKMLFLARALLCLPQMGTAS